MSCCNYSVVPNNNYTNLIIDNDSDVIPESIFQNLSISLANASAHASLHGLSGGMSIYNNLTTANITSVLSLSIFSFADYQDQVVNTYPKLCVCKLDVCKCSNITRTFNFRLDELLIASYIIKYIPNASLINGALYGPLQSVSLVNTLPDYIITSIGVYTCLSLYILIFVLPEVEKQFLKNVCGTCVEPSSVNNNLVYNEITNLLSNISTITTKSDLYSVLYDINEYSINLISSTKNVSVNSLFSNILTTRKIQLLNLKSKY